MTAQMKMTRKDVEDFFTLTVTEHRRAGVSPGLAWMNKLTYGSSIAKILREIGALEFIASKKNPAKNILSLKPELMREGEHRNAVITKVMERYGKQVREATARRQRGAEKSLELRRAKAQKNAVKPGDSGPQEIERIDTMADQLARIEKKLDAIMEAPYFKAVMPRKEVRANGGDRDAA